MPEGPQNLTDVIIDLKAEVREVLGDRASEWIVKPRPLLDGLTPAEVAVTPAGKRVVIHELKRAAVPLRAAAKRRRIALAQ